jgi:hypothetical protein
MQHARLTLRRRALVALALALAGRGAFAQDGGFRFAGTQRTRYETLDPQFRAGFSNSDQALALQTSVTFDWRSNGVQVFGEIMDSRAELNDAGSFANGSTTNTLEPIQAFVAWKRGAGTFRFGRVTQDIGKRRLLARARFGNTVANFTGFDWSWSNDDGRALRAFRWIPMRALPSDLASVLDNETELDRGTRDSSFAGLYYQFRALPKDVRLETYLFDYVLDPESDPASAADHRSLGVRVYRAPKPGQWSYEAEAIVQRGRSGGTVAGVARSDLAHRASLLHLDLGYSFDHRWAPILSVNYDYASGDKSPTDLRNERFNTLFGDRRFEYGPTNIYGLVPRSNIDAPSVRLTLRPTAKWQAMLAYRVFRLAEARDGWVGSGWRDASGAAGRSVGQHLEGSATLSAIPDRLSIELGFARLGAERFAEQTAATAFRGDPRYFYLATNVTF